jgi:hypothetical protein
LTAVSTGGGTGRCSVPASWPLDGLGWDMMTSKGSPPKRAQSYLLSATGT